MDWYDYGARFYDGVLGRFMSLDPLADKYSGLSPYVYCANNPIYLIDPTGIEMITYYSTSDPNEIVKVINQLKKVGVPIKLILIMEILRKRQEILMFIKQIKKQMQNYLINQMKLELTCICGGILRLKMKGEIMRKLRKYLVELLNLEFLLVLPVVKLINHGQAMKMLMKHTQMMMKLLMRGLLQPLLHHQDIMYRGLVIG
ncbi:MAG: RHS repeat-associated core domain-containing protein [Bacteroidota bacterium]|nr:RHS repeat-associated core domain-containing protein [Bacteroidota bacterium]